MKQANIVLKLSKEHEVPLVGVTPVEVIVLSAEHHRNVGGNPVEVDKTSIKDVGHEEIYDHVVSPAVAAVPAKDGKPAIPAKEAVVEQRKRWKAVPRSIDDECNRLRVKYGSTKVDLLLMKVRDIPTEDFDKAVQVGVTLVFPSGKLAEHKLL